MTKIIDPVDSVGAKGALNQAIEDRRSMFAARMRGNTFGRYVDETLRRAVEEENSAHRQFGSIEGGARKSGG